ncbi:hypothetical protein SU69_02695 [Thermosipho melanesiensis]|uniref:Uncharacterized protein n=2 Tax=Thermosipho melanesiensis TaxID=46541 RepID=A6LKE2_THEM4|nr:hypothetical protein [Thermosipho melanesiensis]ABR30393.1 hypothetical protein Tmel_0526 [Thermosipho melanesiensis BI429]APT73555.1 hypothetical protein BW47_02810 [Thermosipho melanesiensis]OOC37506.1 hypothetical protein SU68_02715 [Thermosipho melanesiensis]OOC39545.1 hypothetical protein SU69_02695 [Thermosipho melanesiensis]OOC39562.1 hypothetical protein SU70_02695 [Thermosipho melanesiensis]
MAFFLFLTIYFQILLSAKIAYIPLENILKNVSLICLGSLGDLTLSYNAGVAAGYILKNEGYDAYVVGVLDSLSIDDKEPFHRVNSSAFITAHVYSLFSKGLLTAGVIPLFNGKIIDTEIIYSLNTRNATYPIFVESELELKKIKEMGYKGTVILKEDLEDYIDKIKLFWKIKSLNTEDIRIKILKNSAIWLGGEKKIYINEIFRESGLIIFSKDILDYAQDVLDGYKQPTGRKPW